MRHTDGTSEEKPRPTPAERQGLAGEASADGRGDDEADRREEARRRARVMAAVGEFMGRRNRGRR